MKINHLSVSRSQTYNQCNQAYKFQYHLEIPREEPEEPYFTYGSLVHKIIETYTLNKGARDLGQIKQEVMNGVIPLKDRNVQEQVVGPQPVLLPMEYLNRLQGELGAFAKLSSQIGTDGLCEWGFDYDLDPPHGKMLHGYIDRIIQKDGKLFIIDYKTTKKGFWRKNQDTIKTDLQLQCYTMVAAKAFNVETENIKAALFYLQGGELVGARFSQKTIEATHEYMKNLYNKIAEHKPDEVYGNVGSHCRRCTWKKICPFFN